MKKVFGLVLLVFCFLKAFSQEQLPINEKSYTDSLLQVLKAKSADSAKANANFLLAEYWKFKDTLKSKSYLKDGRQLGDKYPFLNAMGFFYEGQYYFNWNTAKAAKAFKTAEEKLGAFHSNKAYNARAAAWFNYALMNKNEKGYNFIVNIILNNSVKLVEKSGDNRMLGHYYSQLATVFMNNYQFAKAEVYNNKAIALLEKCNCGPTNLLFAYLGGVSIYAYQNKLAAAKPLLDKAKVLLAPYPESVNYPLYFYNECLYYTGKEIFNKALVSVEQGIPLAKKYHQTQLLQLFYFRKYDVLQRMGQYSKAKDILMAVLKEGTFTREANDRSEVYIELAKTNKNLGDFKEAYTWLTKHWAVEDSLNKSQTKVKINELETRYRTAENQHKIVKLQSQNQEAKLAARNDRLYSWLFGIGCLLLLLLSGFISMQFVNARKFSVQKEINHKQQIKDLEQKQQLKLTKAILDSEERERERVARDLHDGLGGMLSGVSIGLNGWANNNQGNTHDKDLYRIINQLDTSVGELRRIARNMMPETLIKFGIETALKDLCEFYMQEGLHIEFQTFSIEKNISMATQLNIYRIVQELISNAIKHARATNIVLQCSQNTDTFFITIEDNGIGFDAQSLANSKGMGLNNLKNRIAFLKGKFEILSAPEEGTTINIELSIKDEQ